MRGTLSGVFPALIAAATAVAMVPEERTAIFPKERALEFIHAVCLAVPSGVTGFWTPAMTDAKGVEAGLISYLQSRRPEAAQWLERWGQLKDEWRWVRRQLAGLSRGEEKFLLISYWIEDPRETEMREAEIKAKRGAQYRPDSWKERPVQVNDGSFRYFRVLYDLKRREFV